jgi:basic membrane lipoprotein Med (substrate-binding protein (PBP1-ABC) superfamily)
MAQPKAPKDLPAMDDKSSAKNAMSGDEQVKRESSVQYRNSIEKINRSQDRDIERALSR